MQDDPGDELMTREAFEDNKIGNTLHGVRDGEEALDFLHRHGKHSGAPRPDLILLDLNLPTYDGRQVLEKIRSDPELSHIPVVVPTTFEAEEDILRSYRLHPLSCVGLPGFSRGGKRTGVLGPQAPKADALEAVDQLPLPATGSVVGIDMGIVNFLADSNGGFVPNPRHGEKAAAKLEKAQQALSRCKRGSKRRRKAVETVVRLHRKVGRQRLDHAHRTALDLVREHDFIAHEDLKIRNMSKSPAPRPDPDQPGSFLPNGASAKAGLNRSIADAGWGVFLAILAAKDKFRCQACGHNVHADTVGALNVPRAGLVRRDAAPA